MQTHSLADTINRARAAIIGSDSPPPAPLAPSRPAQRLPGASTPTVTVKIPPPSAATILQAVKVSPDSTAGRLFTLLHDTASHALEVQGHTVTPNQHVIHQPVEIVAAALGVSRVTLYKHLKTLSKLGVIDARAHHGNWYGLTRATGTLFAVALKPRCHVRVRGEDLKHQHRDLQADTASGIRTAWKFLGGLQSHPKPAEAADTALKAWAVKPGNTENARYLDCKGGLAATVYSLETLLNTHKTRRAELIDRLALALARGFLDHSNVNFWRKLLWDALRRDWEGQDTVYQLQMALTRLRADIDEWKDLKAPGALLVHRLKACGLWETLKYA